MTAIAHLDVILDLFLVLLIRAAHISLIVLLAVLFLGEESLDVNL